MDIKVSYGKKGRIGLISPDSGWNIDPEFYAMAPEGVSIVTTRVHLEEVTEENLVLMGDDVGEAARFLSFSNADVIVLGCTSGSFIKGKEYDATIIKRIQNGSGGITATTTATAVANAIKAFGVKKVAVGAPYKDKVNAKAKNYLEDCGFEVVNLVGMGLDWDIDKVPLEDVEELIRKTNTPDAEMIAILCTSMKGVGMLKRLEVELGKPIITATQATFWECLNLLGNEYNVTQFGSLFYK